MPARKANTRRKRRKTAILTDTPEKNLIEAETSQRQKKKQSAMKKQHIEPETSEEELFERTDSVEYLEEELSGLNVVN